MFLLVGVDGWQLFVRLHSAQCVGSEQTHSARHKCYSRVCMYDICRSKFMRWFVVVCGLRILCEELAHKIFHIFICMIWCVRVCTFFILVYLLHNTSRKWVMFMFLDQWFGMDMWDIKERAQKHNYLAFFSRFVYINLFNYRFWFIASFEEHWRVSELFTLWTFIIFFVFFFQMQNDLFVKT